MPRIYKFFVHLFFGGNSNFNIFLSLFIFLPPKPVNVFLKIIHQCFNIDKMIRFLFFHMVPMVTFTCLVVISDHTFSLCRAVIQPVFVSFLISTLDPTNEVTAVLLPLVEVRMVLISSIQDSCLARIYNLAYKRTLTPFPFGQMEFLRYALIDVKADMGLEFIGALPI